MHRATTKSHVEIEPAHGEKTKNPAVYSARVCILTDWVEFFTIKLANMVECCPERLIRNFKIRLEHDQSHRHSCTLHSGLHWAKVIMPNGIPARRAPVASAGDPRTRHRNCEARQRSSQGRRQHTCQQCPFRASTLQPFSWKPFQVLERAGLL